MATLTNRVVRLKRRPPPGLPGPETWNIADEPVRRPGEGELLVRMLFISIDAPMRHWITTQKAGHFAVLQEGDVMRTGESVGEVVESNARGFKAGQLVTGAFGVQKYWTGAPQADTEVLDPGQHPPERYLGVLGGSGLTAYFGLLSICNPQPGEVVLVSSAAGAVGALAGEIARIKGCHVIGIAGGPEKCAYVVDTLGFDSCIDYKKGDLLGALRKHAPDGIDIYFDNVGGESLEAALACLKFHARISLSGAIADYNDLDAVRGPRNYLNLRQFRSRMEGFVVLDYAAEFGKARAEISQWVLEGKAHALEHIEEGIDRFPEVMPMLFTGANRGKLILKV